MSRFNDLGPVRLVLTIDRGALAALKDHPALLQPDEPGAYFVSAVHRGVKALSEAAELEGEWTVGGEFVPTEDSRPEIRHDDASDRLADVAIEAMGTLEDEYGFGEADLLKLVKLAMHVPPDNSSPEDAGSLLASAEDCENAGLVGAAQALREAASRHAEAARLRRVAAAALERADVGDADEAAAILRQIVQLDGSPADRVISLPADDEPR